MLLLLRALFIFPFFFLVALVCVVLCLLRPFHANNSRLCGWLFSRSILPLLNIRVDVEGLKHLHALPPSVIVANHLSNFDLFVYGGIIPQRTVSIGKKSLRLIPFFGQVYWLAGNIMIDRADRKGSIAALEQVVGAMHAQRKTIWVFPEGTRGQGQGMQSFKKGAFHIAIQAQVPIVPICASNYPASINLRRWRTGLAKISVLPPVSTEGLNAEDIPELMAKVHAQMATEVNRLDAMVAEEMSATKKR